MQSLVPFYKKHHAGGHYGAAGFRKVTKVLDALAGVDIKTVLDWGAGAQTLSKALRNARPGWVVTSYDPAIPGIDVRPDGPFDAVVSTDVLEHIPYEEIDSVIQELIALTGKVGYHHIATFPASLRLPDGRDAHLILQPAAWWKERFEANGATVSKAFDTAKPNGRDPTYACITIVKEPSLGNP